MLIAVGILAVIILYSVYGGTVTPVVSNDPASNPGYIPPAAINPAEYAIENARLLAIANYAATEGKNFLPGNIVAPIPVIDPIAPIEPITAERLAEILRTINPDGSLKSLTPDIGYIPPPENNPVPAVYNQPVTPEPTISPDSVFTTGVDYGSQYIGDPTGNIYMRDNIVESRQ
jgi:hypothetical protein